MRIIFWGILAAITMTSCSGGSSNTSKKSPPPIQENSISLVGCDEFDYDSEDITVYALTGIIKRNREKLKNKSFSEIFQAINKSCTKPS